MLLKDQWTPRTKVEGDGKMQKTISFSMKEKVKEKEMRRVMRRMWKKKAKSKGF